MIVSSNQFSANEAWLMQLLRQDPNNIAYTLSIILGLEGVLNIEALEKSFATVMQNHAIFSTGYNIHEMNRRIHSSHQWKLTIEYADYLDQVTFDQRVKEKILQCISIPFEYEHPPLMRAMLIRKGKDQWILCVVLSHLIADGMSIAIFIKEIFADYQKILTDDLSDLKAIKKQQYQIFIQNQANLKNIYYKNSDFLKKQAHEWTEPNLIYNGNTKYDLAHIESLEFNIVEDVYKKIKTYCRTTNHAPYTVCLSLWIKTICEFFELENLSLKILSANRHNPLFKSIIGFMANGLVLNSVYNKQNFHSLINQTRKNLKLINSFAEYPFEWFHLFKNQTNHRSCKLVFNWHHYVFPAICCKDLFVKLLMNYVPQNHMWNDGSELSCNFYTFPHRIAGRIRYRARLFSHSTIENIINNFLCYVNTIDHC